VVKDRHNSYPAMEAVFFSETPEYFYYTAHHHNKKKGANFHRQNLRYRRDKQKMIIIVRPKSDGHNKCPLAETSRSFVW
jgi:hypothetical protein